MAKGAHVQGQAGYSLADAIDGSAPGGVSDDRSEPPPARCRWPGCGTFLSIRNRPKRRRKAAKPEAPANTSPPDLAQLNESGVLPVLVAAEMLGLDTGLAEAVRSSEEPKRIKQSDPPDDEQLCFTHQTHTRDWHMGLTDVRPAHYPPEDPLDDVRKKSKKT